MNSISSLLRIVCGSAVLFLAWSSWSKNKAAIAAGAPAEIFGQAIKSDGNVLTIAFGVIGLIGVGLLLLGIIGLLRGQGSK
jgi:hypothetical protein